MVRYIAKIFEAMVHLRNMALMESLFPLVLVSFGEIYSTNRMPGLQFNTPTKETILSRLLLSNGRFALPDKLVTAYY